MLNSHSFSRLSVSKSLASASSYNDLYNSFNAIYPALSSYLFIKPPLSKSSKNGLLVIPNN